MVKDQVRDLLCHCAERADKPFPRTIAEQKTTGPMQRRIGASAPDGTVPTAPISTVYGPRVGFHGFQRKVAPHIRSVPGDNNSPTGLLRSNNARGSRDHVGKVTISR
jgi:hypothetical protein